MELSEIWLGIIIPIIIGPVFVYFKSLRDEVVERKFRRKREKYEEERNTIFNELNLFFWPVYINLLCIEQYSFSLPIRNKFRYESKSSLGEYNSNTSDSEDFFPKEEDSKQHVNSNQNEIDSPNLTINYSNNENENLSNDFEITIPINESTSFKYNNSSDSSLTKHKTIILDKDTLKMLENNLNNKYIETINIIEKNMTLVCIHQNLNIEIIKFLKYAKIREIIHEGSPEREYNIEYFGVENNIEKFIYEIKTILKKLNDKYSNLLNNPI
jgi:hypothetical protein